MLIYAAETDLGNQRSNNEDCYLAAPELCLWVMADGVGGQDAGEVASKIACDVIKSEVEGGAGLDEAVSSAHLAIQAAPEKGVGTPGMASTVVALLVHGSEYQIAWVGDSRAYLWSHDRLEQLTHDQSLVQRLIDEGVISEEEAVNHPRRNLVIQALGQEKLEAVEVETVRGEFNEGDQILLCSDGLTDYVSDVDIKQYMETCPNEKDLAKALIKAALATEGKDNITVVVVNMVALQMKDTQIINSSAMVQALGKQRVQKMVGILLPLFLLGAGLLWFLSLD